MDEDGTEDGEAVSELVVVGNAEFDVGEVSIIVMLLSLLFGGWGAVVAADIVTELGSAAPATARCGGAVVD